MIDFIYLERTGSTNNDLIRLAKQGAPEGTAIAAGHQMQGRGRRGRLWSDDADKSALVSVLLRFDGLFKQIGLLAPMVAVAVRSVLQKECGIACKIKWPNDLIVADKKIAGILVECLLDKNCSAIAAGVGINVLQNVFGPELEPKATSVAILGGNLISPKVLSECVASEVVKYWKLYKAHGSAFFLNDWNSSLYGVGKRCRIESGKEQHYGILVGGDDEGSLRIALPDGTFEDIIAADTVSVLF